MQQNTPDSPDTVAQLAAEFEESNNVVGYNIERYPEHSYDSILVEFTPKGYNFVLLHGEYDLQIKDISAINEDGNINAVIHVYDDE
jgi:hypothetical protein